MLITRKAPRHRRRLLLLAAAVGLAAVGLAGTAGGATRAKSAGFSDPVGDSGNAPDIGAVRVRTTIPGSSRSRSRSPTARSSQRPTWSSC